MIVSFYKKQNPALLLTLLFLGFQSYTLDAFSQAQSVPTSISQSGAMASAAKSATVIAAKDFDAKKDSDKAQSTQPATEPSSATPPASAPSGTPIQARAVHVLSLTDALTFMEQQNAQLAAARKNMLIGEAGIKVANEIPNPQFQGSHYWGNIVALGTNEQVGITQQIETAGKRHKRVMVAKAQNRLNQAQYNALLWDLRSQTRQAYVQLAAAKENILLLDAQDKLAQNLVDIANKRVTAGAAPISELLQARLAYSQVVTQKVQAQTQLRQARGQLNALIGNPLTPGGDEGYDISDEGYFHGNAKTELVPFPHTPIPSYESLLKQASEKRPDLVAALRQVEVNQNQLKLTQAQKVPDMFVSVGYPFLKVKQSVAPIDNRTYYQGFWAQVGFTLPVFHNQGPELQQGQHTLAQSQLQVKAVQQQLVGEIYTALQGLNGTRENIRLYRYDLLPSSDEVLRLAQKSYQVGKTGLTSVIVAQQQLHQIRQSYVQCVLDYHKAWSDLEKAVGSRLDF